MAVNDIAFVAEQEIHNPSKGFIFIQAADTQFGLIDECSGIPHELQVWDKEIALTKKAIEAANKIDPLPKFFIVCGDLVNDFPGEKHRENQESDFKNVFKDLHSNIPLICVCGNHDIGNIPTKETVESYRSSFGPDYFSFWVGGSFFIVLNSQYYADHSKVPEEYEKQENWLDEQLLMSKTKQPLHVIIFQHIPWFLQHPDEDDEYFNMPKRIRLPILKKLKEAGVKKVFSGHYHRNAGGYDEHLEVVVTSAIGFQLGTDKSGLRLVKVSANAIEHKYYSLDELPLTFDLNIGLP